MRTGIKLTSVTVVNSKEVSDNLVSRILDIENGSMRILHADTPSLHFGDGIKDGSVAARRRGLLRDGLGKSLTHFEGLRSSLRCSGQAADRQKWML